MKIGWALDMIGWACAQPFPTLATPLVGTTTPKNTTANILHVANQPIPDPDLQTFWTVESPYPEICVQHRSFMSPIDF